MSVVYLLLDKDHKARGIGVDQAGASKILDAMDDDLSGPLAEAHESRRACLVCTSSQTLVVNVCPVSGTVSMEGHDRPNKLWNLNAD